MILARNLKMPRRCNAGFWHEILTFMQREANAKA